MIKPMVNNKINTLSGRTLSSDYCNNNNNKKMNEIKKKNNNTKNSLKRASANINIEKAEIY